MEAMYGKWETVPSLTENFDAFCDKADIPQDKREAYKSMVSEVTIEKKGNGMRVVFEVRGTPIKQDLTFEPGVPLSYKGLEGEEMTSCYTVEGNKMIDKCSSVNKEGKTITWETERYVEGDMLVAINKKDGVNMVTKLKRMQ